MTHYNAQNLLARSLNPQCYENNPGFRQFLLSTGLPFKPSPRSPPKASSNAANSINSWQI